MELAKPIGQAAILLLDGWGYNLYREENRVRADDLLIRNKVGGILAEARNHLGALEAAYRRRYLAPPTRENPLPDRASVEQARLIARCGTLIEPVALAIQSAAVPTNDAVWRRHRSELGILELLQRIDVRLVEAAVSFHDFTVELDLDGISAATLEAAVTLQLKPLKLIVQERAERLTILA